MSTTKNVFPDPSERKWSCALTGVIYWALFGGAIKLLYPIIEAQSHGDGGYSVLGIVLIIVLVGLGFLGLHFAVGGWDFAGRYKLGTVGYVLKLIALFFFVLLFGLLPGGSLFNPASQIICRSISAPIAVVALLMVGFLTGRGILRQFYGGD